MASGRLGDLREDLLLITVNALAAQEKDKGRQLEQENADRSSVSLRLVAFCVHVHV